MAYIGSSPAEKGIGLFSQDTFTGDGSTTTFDLSNVMPDGGSNDIQVFVDNVRQQSGSSKAFTIGNDGSGDLKRITFTTAPAASAAIYVLNPGTKNVQQISTISDNAVTTAKVQDDAVTTAKVLDSNITAAKIAADAINATKIADDAISEEHLDVTAITGHTELAEEANNSDVLLVFDASTSTLKKIQRSNLILQAPTITSVSPTTVLSGDGTGNHTFIINGTGFTAASAALINNSGTTVNFDTVTVNSSIKITGVIAKSSLPGSGEPYDVKVTGATGLATTLENQINLDQSPTYNTSSGSIGSVSDGGRGSAVLEVVAFDPESAGNVSFEIQSGSLPAGVSTSVLNENGVSKFRISGFNAVGTNTTSNFVLRAVDAASNTSSRAFAITVLAPASTSFTSSGTFSVPTGVTSVSALVVAGGGGSSGNYAGGGGAGGLIFMPAFPVTPGGTVSVTVGDGGAVGPSDRGSSGQDSVFGTLTAKGGGGGGRGSASNPTGGDGGSGGGGSGPGVNAGGSGQQSTQSGNSGAYGFGNNGGNGGGTYGGGGGGAGAAGNPGQNPSDAGDGGIGKAYTIADGTSSVYYAGGGGAYDGGHPSGSSGGQGGGGNGGPNGPAVSGRANKGGGGGALGAPSDNTSGAKGIVIVRY